MLKLATIKVKSPLNPVSLAIESLYYSFTYTDKCKNQLISYSAMDESSRNAKYDEAEK